MNKIALIIAAAGVAAFSGTAFAQAAPSFAQADTDHDGFVDFGEAQIAYPGLTQHNFDQVDTNKDGKLTQDEYNQLGGEQYNNNNNSNNSSSASK